MLNFSEMNSIEGKILLANHNNYPIDLSALESTIIIALDMAHFALPELSPRLITSRFCILIDIAIFHVFIERSDSTWALLTLCT